MPPAQGSHRALGIAIAFAVGSVLAGTVAIVALIGARGSADRDRIAARSESEAATVRQAAAQAKRTESTKALNAVRSERDAAKKTADRNAKGLATQQNAVDPERAAETRALITFATTLLATAEREARTAGEEGAEGLERMVVDLAKFLNASGDRRRAAILPELDLALGSVLTQRGLFRSAATHFERAFRVQSIGTATPQEAFDACLHYCTVCAALGYDEQLLLTYQSAKGFTSQFDDPDRELRLIEMDTDLRSGTRDFAANRRLFEQRIDLAHTRTEEPRRERNARLAFARYLHRVPALGDAEAMARTVVETDALIGSPTDRFEGLLCLSWILFDAGRHEEATKLHVDVMKAMRSDEVPVSAVSVAAVADYLIVRREWETAELVLKDCWKRCSRPETPMAAAERVANAFIRLYEATGRKADAATWQATLHTLRTTAGEREKDKKSPTTPATKNKPKPKTPTAPKTPSSERSPSTAPAGGVA